jgi:uncharacterized protein YndB with AHSA1/START domain
MLNTILVIIIVVIAGVLGYAATRPDDFVHQRSAIINAAPETIFPYINDFEQWRAWSPYETKDPAMARTYDAIKAGKGAGYAWDGNKEIGAGRMDITDTEEPSRITIRLEFFRPFKSVCTTEFTLRPVAGGTEVQWKMFGKSSFIPKLMGIFFDMDPIIGRDFEQGLAALKALGERQEQVTQTGGAA